MSSEMRGAAWGFGAGAAGRGATGLGGSSFTCATSRKTSWARAARREIVSGASKTESFVVSMSSGGIIGAVLSAGPAGGAAVAAASSRETRWSSPSIMSRCFFSPSATALSSASCSLMPVDFSLIFDRLSRRDCSCCLWSFICVSSGSVTACTQRSLCARASPKRLRACATSEA